MVAMSVEERLAPLLQALHSQIKVLDPAAMLAEVRKEQSQQSSHLAAAVAEHLSRLGDAPPPRPSRPASSRMSLDVVPEHAGMDLDEDLSLMPAGVAQDELLRRLEVRAQRNEQLLKRVEAKIPGRNGAAVVAPHSVTTSIKAPTQQAKPTTVSHVSARVPDAQMNTAVFEYTLAKGWRIEAPHQMADRLEIAPGLEGLVESVPFHFGVTIAIIANAVALAVAADHEARTGEDYMPCTVIRGLCTAVFLMEMGVRLAAKKVFFAGGPDAHWNLAELLIVVVSAVEFFVAALSSTGNLQNVALLRLVRLLRFGTVFRAVVAARQHRDVRLLVNTISRAAKPFLAMSAVVALFACIFGAVFATAVGDVRRSQPFEDELDETLVSLYGTLGHSVQTLVFASLRCGDLSLYAEPLFAMGWIYSVCFFFYLGAMSIAVLNVFTGSFVLGVMEVAHEDARRTLQEELRRDGSDLSELRRSLADGETQGSGRLTANQLESVCRGERVTRQLAALGVDSSELKGLFRLLDIEDTGVVETEELAIGCLRLRADTRELDLAGLLYENKRLFKRLESALRSLSPAPLLRSGEGVQSDTMEEEPASL